MTIASSKQANSYTPEIYLIGSGIAGLLTALTLHQRYQKLGWQQPHIHILEQAQTIAPALTFGNGWSLSVSEGLTAAGASTEDRQRLASQLVSAGGLLYPGFIPTAQDSERLGRYVSGQVVPQPNFSIDRADAERLDTLIRFGFVSLELWRQFAQDYPTIAAQAGLRFHEKFKVYDGTDAIAQASAEVARIRRIGTEFDQPDAARLIDSRELLAQDPALAVYINQRLDTQGRFWGAITGQPGGVVDGYRLVQALATYLQASGHVHIRCGVEVQSLERDCDQRIAGLKVRVDGQASYLGTAKDQYIVATGCDRLLYPAGFTSQPIFPMAGTTITLPVSEHAIRQRIPFCRQSWKYVGLGGSLVVSPLFVPHPAYLDFLDQLQLDTTDFEPQSQLVQELGFFDAAWAQTVTPQSFDLASLDPRQIDVFDPNVVGPKAGYWRIRIGGLKFYPGQQSLDLQHPGAEWAIQEQVQRAIEFMPRLVAQILELELSEVLVNPAAMAQRVAASELVEKISPWVGARPLYDDGMAAVGLFCANGVATTGTGSWGMTCGVANAEAIAQFLTGVPVEHLKIGSLSPAMTVRYLEAVNPTRLQSGSTASRSARFSEQTSEQTEALLQPL